MSLEGPDVTLFNHDTGEEISIPIRPSSFSEQVGVSYSKLGVVGQSHRRMQYNGTMNRMIPAISFSVDEHFLGPDEDIMDLRNFLMALTVPGEGLSGPARVTLSWPDVITFTGFVLSVDIKRTQFSDTGGVTGYTASVSFEEYVPSRRTADLYRRGVA